MAAINLCLPVMQELQTTPRPHRTWLAIPGGGSRSVRLSPHSSCTHAPWLFCVTQLGGGGCRCARVLQPPPPPLTAVALARLHRLSPCILVLLGLEHASAVLSLYFICFALNRTLLNTA